ncbi:flagellar M-ring protein FliF [bacterium]|nr:flagellar M-ring protein FliF [bacterium]
MIRIKEMWEKFTKLSLVKKSIIIFAFFFIFVVIFFLLMSPKDEKYVFLYREMSEEDAALVADELKTMKTPFKVSDSGNIMVLAEDVAKLRLSLAQKKIVGKGIGFELLDKQKYGMTNFMEQLNYIRALQGELAKTINQLDSVESSRVHIVLPKRAVFKEDSQDATASIVLKLKKNEYLSKKQVDGIIHLVAGSVEGLKPENISIVDSYGKKLNEQNDSMFSNIPLEYQRKYEEKLTMQVQEILDRALGTDNSVVKVEAELDFDEQSKAEEVYDPDGSAIRSEKLSQEQNTKGDDRIGGIPGAESNNPQNGTATGMVTRGGNSEKSKKMEIRNYEISKTVKQIKATPGKVKKISVAVLINGSYVKKDGKNQYVPRSEEEVKTYLEIVKKAVGYSIERGDQVEVANVPFLDVEKDIEIVAPFYKKGDFYLTLFKYIFYMIMIIVVFMILRSMLGWAMMKEEEVDAIELQTGEEMRELAEGDSSALSTRLREGEAGIDKLSSAEGAGITSEEMKEESLEMKLRRKINEIAYENPEKVLQIIRYWIVNK